MPHRSRPPRPLVAALQPRSRGRLSRAARGTIPVLAGLGLGAILLTAAELHLTGPAGLVVRVAVAGTLATLLGFAVARLRTRIEVMEAIRRGQDALGEGVLLVDLATLRVVHASPAAAALFGRPLDAFVGLDLLETCAPEDRRVIEERRRLRAAGHRVPDRVALRIDLPDGDHRSIEWATTPLAVGGRPLLLSIVRDITAAERAKHRLADEHAFMEAVLDAAAGPIVVTDARGRLLRVNPAAAALAGRPAADLIGCTPWELGLMTPDEATAIASGLRAARDPQRHVVTRAGRVVSWTATEMRGGAIVCVGLDVTDRRAAEDRAERAHAALDLRSTELERSTRDLAHVAELASHDLREAVQAVGGYAELLDAHAGAQLDERAAGFLAATRDAAAAMGGLLDGLSAYTRLGRGEALASDVDTQGTLDAVLGELAAEIAGCGAAVSHDPMPIVAGDPDELRTLLSQLVANALRGGGERVHVGAERRGLGWQLTVSDDGAGVPEAERRDVFQLSSPRAGAGVGLALCRRIVERHGGAIWIDEAAGGGSAFHVALPDRDAR